MRFPSCFLESVIDRGEERLYENASVSHDAQPLSAKVEKTRLDRIESDLSKSLIMLPREAKGGKVVFDPCFYCIADRELPRVPAKMVRFASASSR